MSGHSRAYFCVYSLPFPDFLFKKAGILSVSHVGKMDMVCLLYTSDAADEL